VEVIVLEPVQPEPRAGHQVGDGPVEMAAADHPPVQRGEPALDPGDPRVGRAPVLHETQRATGPQHPVGLGQGPARVRDAAQRPGAEHEVGAAAGHRDRLGIGADELDRHRMGGDPRLMDMPWSETTLEILRGPSDGHDLNAVSAAFAGIAETGTLALVSGPDNPTTLNFLPDDHIVLLPREAIEADYESVFAKVRSVYGKGEAPRTLNFITGPSRSADIEQTLLLGAHGPRRASGDLERRSRREALLGRDGLAVGEMPLALPVPLVVGDERAERTAGCIRRRRLPASGGAHCIVSATLVDASAPIKSAPSPPMITMPSWAGSAVQSAVRISGAARVSVFCQENQVPKAPWYI